MQQKTKSIIRFVAIATLVLLSLYYFPLLYFGCASFITTILVYTLLYIVAVKLIDVLNSYYKPGINPNVKILLATTTICLLCGEFALRFVFKKNLTYKEQRGENYISSYTYIYNWQAIINQLAGNKNYWLLTRKPKSTKSQMADNHIFHYSYNSLGFREDEKQPQNNDPDNLVIGIGDSFAEGIGTVSDSTWLQLMADKLNTDTNCHIRTYNTGVSGSDVYFEYVVLEKMLQTYHPNIVVLGINSTDIDEVILRGGRNRFPASGRLKYNSPPWWEPLYAVSFIFRAALHSKGKYDWTLLTVDEKAIKSKQALDSIESTVYRFNSLVKNHQAKLVVVFHPREAEITTGKFPYDTLAAKLEADTGLYVLNLHKEFARSGLITKQNSSAYYWKTDLHHNASGYRVMGVLIAEYMRAKGLVCNKHQ